MRTPTIQLIDEAWKAILPKSAQTRTLEVADYSNHLTTKEQQLLTNSSQRRIHEFSTSRFAARSLLSNHELKHTDILICPEGAPLWPHSWTGSISHSKGICTVALAPLGKVKSIGIDLETRFRIKEKIWPKIASENEVETLLRYSKSNDLQMIDTMGLLFSIKEAFFKYQYPHTSTWMGFLEAKINPTDSGFNIRTTSNNHVASDLANQAIIRHKTTEQHLLSAVYSTP